MKAKVTLKEIVAERMVYVLLLVHYYWMWARRDWHDYYMTIQNTINIFAIVFSPCRPSVSGSTAKKKRMSWRFKICAEPMRSA